MRDHNFKQTISVIIPTYNRSKYIKKSINSILQQSYQEFEIIVVDDYSTDNTKELVLGIEDERIRYLRNNQNMGASYSRNIGLDYSKGNYIAFLDDDDEWISNKLEKQIEKFQNSSEKIGIIYCGYKYVNNGNIIKHDIQKVSGDTHYYCLAKSIGSMSLALIRHNCFKIVGGFDDSLPSCQDWDLWIRFSKKFDFDYVDESLVIRHIHGEQITSNVKSKIKGRELILKKHLNEFKNHKKLHSFHIRRIGSLYALENNHKEAQNHFIKAFKINPYDFGNYLHLILSILSKNIHKKVIMKYGIQKIGNTFLYH